METAELDLIGGLTPSQYRRALARVPTSVVVAGAMVDGAPVGMVIGTFTSVSMSPPLVGFFGDRRSKTLPALLSADRWSFGVLAQDDLATSEAFRGPQESRYAGVSWTLSAAGTPHLDRAVLTIDADRHRVEPIGDHEAVIAQVVGVALGDPTASPLVYQAGRLVGIDPRSDDRPGDPAARAGHAIGAAIRRSRSRCRRP